MNKPESAFPYVRNGLNEFEAGLSIRDFFAAYVMCGSLASDTQDWNSGSDYDKAAEIAYLRADAMMRARAKTSDQPPAAP